MIYKRATKKLRDVGITDIVIVKGAWGPYPRSTVAKRQKSKCFATPNAAAQAVIDGFRPTVEEGEGE